MYLMNIRQRTESMNSEEYICHIIVMMRRLSVFMMHMAVQRQPKRKRRKIYTTKKYWKIHAPVHGYVKGITHDASGLFRDDLSEAVNDATDSKAVVDFRPGYLCGFYADMSDVPASEYENYAYVNSKEYINNQIKCKVGSNMYINKTEQEPQI